jgi:hypothetical protein
VRLDFAHFRPIQPGSGCLRHHCSRGATVDRQCPKVVLSRFRRIVRPLCIAITWISGCVSHTYRNCANHPALHIATLGQSAHEHGHHSRTHSIALLLVGEIVRRERRWTFSGCDSRSETGSLHPVAIEAAAEATKLSDSRCKGSLGDSASVQAVTC